MVISDKHYLSSNIFSELFRREPHQHAAARGEVVDQHQIEVSIATGKRNDIFDVRQNRPLLANFE